MNTNRLRVMQIAAAAGLMSAVVPALAGLISLGEQINNGNFQAALSPAWTVTGSAEIRPSGSTINTSTGNAGFDSFFDSAFAVLGDDGLAIGGIPTAGTSSISQTFILPSTVGGETVLSYDLTISFETAFDGIDSASVTGDIFSASFGTTTLFSQNSNAFPPQAVNDPFNATITGLAPGTYTLTFTLDESGIIIDPTNTNFTNTAAGIDNVSVIAVARVPEPSTLALLGVALAGAGLTRLRRRERRLC